MLSIIGFASADIDTRSRDYVEATYSGNSGYDNVRDVFVYDGQGRPVENAQLYDQEGNPIQLGSQYCSDPETGESWTSWQRGYPRCPEQNPFRSPSASPSDSPAVSGSPSPSPSPSPSVPAAPSASPSR